MQKQFLQARDGEFKLNDKSIILRGFGVGAWMNFENFMLRIPGTEKRIREAFAQVYGQENAATFFDNFLYYFLTEDDLKFLAGLGINVLRFALNYRHFEDDQHPGIYKTDGFKHLDRALELCRKYNIYAILDMHSTPGGQNPAQHTDNQTGVAQFWEDASLRARTIELWGYLAAKYRDETIIAGYDLVNEPCFVSNTEAFNDFFDQVIKKIRSVDQNHIIFLEGDNWSKDFSIFKSLGGYQQALSFHLYPGQHVCMFADQEKRQVEINKILQGFITLREKTGMPLWVGETGGLFPKDKLTEGLRLIKDGLDLFEKHDISWTFWSYKDANAMSIVSPREDTAWMKMGNEFRPRWQVKERRNSTIAKEIFVMLENRYSYSINESLKNQLSFRLSALLDELHVQQTVIPKLQSIPWEEIKNYPKSFLWKNCDYWQELAELVKSYTRQ
ncbi:MAG TPA: cellulase family glycosylhydrolase [bacterium]|nr:cellulase family glycosylhydrolase [bacterium]HPN44839.1 cellulase family glycosylhydrolase [bacterium]